MLQSRHVRGRRGPGVTKEPGQNSDWADCPDSTFKSMHLSSCGSRGSKPSAEDHAHWDYLDRAHDPNQTPSVHWQALPELHNAWIVMVRGVRARTEVRK